MKTTRSATSRAKAISWVTTIIVMPSVGQLLHHREHVADQLGVERRGGLVEEHQLGVHRQRPGDRDALLLAAGELRRVGVVLVGQADPLQVVPGRPRSASALPRRSTRCWAMVRLLQHGQVREEVELLEHHADPPADRVDVDVGVGDLDAADEDRARRSGSSSRLTQRSRVDLPEPDGPMTQTTSPWPTSRSMPLSTSLVAEGLVQVPDRRWRALAGAGRSCGSVVIAGPRRRGAPGGARRCDERQGDQQVAQAADHERGGVGGAG